MCSVEGVLSSNLGLYPIVTLQYRSTTSCQVPIIFSSCFSKVTIGYHPTRTAGPIEDSCRPSFPRSAASSYESPRRRRRRRPRPRRRARTCTAARNVSGWPKTMQVGPYISVGAQPSKADAGPTSAPTRRRSRSHLLGHSHPGLVDLLERLVPLRDVRSRLHHQDLLGVREVVPDPLAVLLVPGAGRAGLQVRQDLVGFGQVLAARKVLGCL